MKQSIQEIANTLDHAAQHASSVEQISKTTQLDLKAAYEVQALSLKNRHQRGEKLSGFKLGFTSRAKMEQMGVHDLIWGRLTDKMHIENGGTLIRKNYIHPRVEPEIAFKIGKRIDKALSLDEVAGYIDSVAGALEIIDSRYENFKFSLEDVIADNCSSTAYIIGEWHAADTPVNNVNLQMNINGEESQTGNSNAILGNPLESLVEISRILAEYGEAIEPGAVILAGAATSAVYINAGDKIEGTFDGLGKVNLLVD